MRAGEKHARWTLLEDALLSKDLVLCRCDCGTTKRVLADTVKDNERRSVGVSKSCGCHKAEVARQRLLKHGLSDNPAWHVWCNMVDRCTNPRSKSYLNYGGRGIKVCDEWLPPDGAAKFIAYMGPRPSLRHSLERLNNDGNYEPGNCVWAATAKQAANKRSPVKNAAYDALMAERDRLRRENEQLRGDNEQLRRQATARDAGPAVGPVSLG